MQAVLVSGICVRARVSNKVALLDEPEHVNMALLAKHLEEGVTSVGHEHLGMTTCQVFVAQREQVVLQVGEVSHLQDSVYVSFNLLLCFLCHFTAAP